MPLVVEGVIEKEQVSIIEPEPDLILNELAVIEEEIVYVVPDYGYIPHELPSEMYEPVPSVYIPPELDFTEDNILEVPQTKSMDMTDNQIRRYLIDNVWLKYNMPIMAWDKLILSTNFSNFLNRVNFINTLKQELKNLSKLPNGKTHSEEYSRCLALAKNIDLIEEEYEEAPQFAIERFKDKIAGFSLAVKITIGISIAVGVVFGLFVLYNYLKSYGTELGIKKARD